jgi:hypothetical protein
MMDEAAVSKQSPAWVRLLRYYQWRPTLPFIVGALREHALTLDAGGDGFEQVLTLLQEMASHRISEEQRLVVYIQLCGQLKVPVFSIVSEGYKRYCRACFPSRVDGETRLCISTDLEKSAAVLLEEMADTLFHGYEHPEAFDLHRYSRDPDKAVWRPFDSQDREKIIAALKREN